MKLMFTEPRLYYNWVGKGENDKRKEKKNAIGTSTLNWK